MFKITPIKENIWLWTMGAVVVLPCLYLAFFSTYSNVPPAVRTPVAVTTVQPAPTSAEEQNRISDDPIWPSAIPMVRAWMIPSKPLLLDVLKKQLPMNAMNQGILLDEEDQAAVERLEAFEVAMVDTQILREQRSRLDTLGGRSRGIMPSTWHGLVTRNTEAPSVTYILRFGSTDCWKIGHTNDIHRRLAEANKFIPHETLGHEGWQVSFTHKWSNSAQAFNMEQLLLSELEKQFKIYGERVTCSKQELIGTWERTIGHLLSTA